MADSDKKAVVKFYPQEWQSIANEKRAVEHSKHSPVPFVVPLEDATDANGDLLETDTYESDELASHPNAPAWVKDWEGPFYIAIEEVK